MTREESIEQFRKLWKEIADKNLSSKSRASTLSGTNYLNDCPLCEYVVKTLNKTLGLEEACQKHCPVIWPKNHYGERICQAGDGLFGKWEYAMGADKQRLAKLIADLPIKQIMSTK